MEWTPPDGWWMGWMVVLTAVAVFRQASPRYFTHLRWAGSDYRLLLQSRGDFVAPWYSGWIQNTMAGMALSLGLAGMSSRAFDMELNLASVLRMLILWWTLMLIRWCVARVWEGVTHGGVAGREWALGHRYFLEATAWLLAPFALIMTMLGPEAALAGLYVALAVWALGWGLRHQRTLTRMSSFRHQPVNGILYLCALEILPVAVLIRAWQW